MEPTIGYAMAFARWLAHQHTCGFICSWADWRREAVRWEFEYYQLHGSKFRSKRIDPTPWCTACGAMTQTRCTCGPMRSCDDGPYND